jgi:Lon protease-like protein
MGPNPPPTSRLLLFPLADEVCFPHSELRLEVTDPEYRELVTDLFLRTGDNSLLGTVLLLPEPRMAEDGGARVFTAGTAARLLHCIDDQDSCEILLRGEYRFRVERELSLGAHLEAVVRPLRESSPREFTSQMETLQREILHHTMNLAWRMGERFPLSTDQLGELLSEERPERVINHLATHLDLPPLHKLRLLQDPLAERARHLAEILHSRCLILDTLQPFRHLAPGARNN